MDLKGGFQTLIKDLMILFTYRLKILDVSQEVPFMD